MRILKLVQLRINTEYNWLSSQGGRVRADGGPQFRPNCSLYQEKKS